MAKINITVSNSVGSVSFDSPTLTDANMARLIEYAWARFPQLDVDGNPLPRTPANEAAAIRDWARNKYRGFVTEVMEWEKIEAAKAAKDAVGDLEG